MKFKIGDFVRLIDERREGYITSIIDDHLVGVSDDDFEIPVSISNITLVHGHTSSKSNNNSELSISSHEFIETGIYLAIVPDQKINAVVQFYLVNQTSWQIPATLSSQTSTAQKGEFAAILTPQSTQKIYTASLTELDKWPEFSFQLLYYSSHNIKTPSPLLAKLKFKVKDFSGSKKEIPVLKQNGWLFRLDEDELVIDAQKLKESFYNVAETPKEIEKPEQSVDLHIEKLRDDFQFLKNSEILDIQLTHFRNKLDAAIVHKLPSIIFIHGSGNGTLRHEIHKQISKHPQVRTFMDASKDKFGYGATEVILK